MSDAVNYINKLVPFSICASKIPKYENTGIVEKIVTIDNRTNNNRIIDNNILIYRSGGVKDFNENLFKEETEETIKPAVEHIKSSIKSDATTGTKMMDQESINSVYLDLCYFNNKYKSLVYTYSLVKTYPGSSDDSFIHKKFLKDLNEYVRILQHIKSVLNV